MFLASAWTRAKNIYFMWITSTVLNRENLRLGSGSHWAAGCWFNCWGGLTIGNNVIIGPNVCISTSNHNFSDPKRLIKNQGSTPDAVVIGDDCWIGANSVIVAGVHIGTGSIIGAGSIVTHDVPAYSVAVGNPAHIIKRRGENMKFEDVMLKLSLEEYVIKEAKADRKREVKVTQ
jgi:acetyltransferase-like isoleucine patch superfamily enzyme